MNKNIEKTTASALLKFGIAPSTKGYFYLLKAVDVCLENTILFMNFSKSLYPEIADLFHVSSTSIERAIRHSIHAGYAYRDTEFAYAVLGNTLQGKNDVPTNTHFISALTEWVRLQ